MRYLGNIDDIFNHIIANAIHNAKKYAMRGAYIKLSTEKTGAKGIITVTDSGLGIPAVHLQRILAQDFNENISGLRGEIGTGWGIKIMRHYAALAQGDLSIEIRSAIDHPEGHGTTVRLTLNLA